MRAVLIIGALLSATASAQQSTVEMLDDWVALLAPTGHEYWATDSLAEAFSGWQRDRSGNLVKTVGSGDSQQMVACALDAPAYAVSQIREDGFLRLHRIGSGSGHPLWDQAHEGQHLTVLTRAGPLLGVTAVANGHFASQHSEDSAIITQDDLWLDMGAESAAEIEAMGISLLDPVVRRLPAWSYAGEVAGPNAGARIGCAAAVAAAEAGIVQADGRTTYVLSSQQAFGWAGMGAALRLHGPVDELIILQPGADQASETSEPDLNGRLQAVLDASGVESVLAITPAVMDSGALMERISEDEAQELLQALIAAIEPDAPTPSWPAAPAPPTLLNDQSGRWGQADNLERLRSIESQLDKLAEMSAVPGHEGPVRAEILAALPGWARDRAETDELGNLWVRFGPAEGELTVFVAHMDEVGWHVESIERDGRVDLERRGGVVTTAWEGQPALLQLDANQDAQSDPDPEQLRGVFLTRTDPATKRPDAVQAWFGMDRAALRDLGVVPGMGITAYKEGHRVGPYRYAARSLDDRVGSTALLLALQGLEADEPAAPVVFAWSVREEGGLVGAGALARRFGMNTRRVYSIDTFVSSDTPLESPHFAYAPLGDGPVLRSIENAGMATPFELDRNRRVAREAGIAAQIGLTQGSTDGTPFTFFGAPNAGLSWPGRYSHSPAEIADLRDVAGLIDLIHAMAVASQD